MVHAIKIEVAPAGPSLPAPADKGAQLIRLRAQVVARLAQLAKQCGGEALAEQAELPAVWPGRGERNSTDRIVSLSRFAGSEKEDLLQAARDAVQGAAWYRIWYHVCRNDEHLPCGKWELIERIGE